MNLEKASQWAEVVGALTVVLGLIFVGLEIRQNTKTQQLTTTQALISDYNQSLMTLSDPEMSCFSMRAMSDWRTLTPVEKYRFSTIMLSILRSWEQMYYAGLDGSLDPEVFDGLDRSFRELVMLKGINEYFEDRRAWFGERFQAYIDEISQGREPVSGYYGFDGCAERA